MKGRVDWLAPLRGRILQSRSTKSQSRERGSSNSRNPQREGTEFLAAFPSLNQAIEVTKTGTPALVEFIKNERFDFSRYP